MNLVGKLSYNDNDYSYDSLPSLYPENTLMAFPLILRLNFNPDVSDANRSAISRIYGIKLLAVFYS